MTTASAITNSEIVVCEIEISAPPDAVFLALTQPENLMRWWTDAVCKAEGWQFDPRPGKPWSARLRSETLSINGSEVFAPHGEILEADPPRLLVYTWNSNWDSEPGPATTVRWELTRTSTGTRVKLTHSGLSHKLSGDYRNGWPSVLSKLKNFVEKRNP